jgi:hypothetical protein
MAYKVFTNGAQLPASDLNTYLMNQAVISFAGSSARASAITSPVEGQLTWLEDSNKYQYYTGSAWADLIPTASAQTISDKSANYTIVAGDNGAMIRSTGSAITITIADVLTPGQKIDFYQAGSGQITFAAGSGVTLQSKGGNLKTSAQYVGATVQCMASGIYALIGDLGA